MTATACRVPECDAPARSTGLCKMHYTRLWRHGDVNAVRAPWRPAPQHGTRSRYRKGCHCDACREAERRYRRQYRRRKAEAARRAA